MDPILGVGMAIFAVATGIPTVAFVAFIFFVVFISRDKRGASSYANFYLFIHWLLTGALVFMTFSDINMIFSAFAMAAIGVGIVALRSYLRKRNARPSSTY